MPMLKILAAALALGALAGCATLGSHPASVAANGARSTAPAAGTVPAVASASGVADAAEPAPPLATSTAPVTAWKDLTVKGAAPVADLWIRMRNGFALPDGNEHRVRQQMRWYRDHPGYMMRTALRAKPYLYYILGQLAKRGMPTDFALLPVVESAYDPFAYSSSDASGLWQFIPSTGRHYGLAQNWWYDGRRDVAAATNAALDYLQDLHKRFDGNWLLALAAYNSGGITVEHAIERNRRRGRPTDFWHLDLPRQTRAYVPRLLAVRDLIDHPEKYGIELPFIANAPYLARIPLKGQIDLAIAADMAGLSVKQMYLLNPGYSRWATPPDGPSDLFIPRDEKPEFLAKLDKMKTEVMAKWTAHRVRRGETLSGIAAHYHTSVAVLRHRNDIHGSLIRTGHTLMIPSPSAHVTRYVLGSSKGGLVVKTSRPSVVRVENGDTLWGLARTYHVSVAKLARWNHISRNAALRIGQRLRIWPGAGSTAQSYAQGHSKPTVVRVASGDTLSALAHTYHVSVAHIAGWNHVSRNATLHIGQELKIWPGAGSQRVAAGTGKHRRIHYVVRDGDSLWSISDHFNVSLSKLANWNSISLKSILHPGQQLTLFVDNSG